MALPRLPWLLLQVAQMGTVRCWAAGRARCGHHCQAALQPPEQLLTGLSANTKPSQGDLPGAKDLGGSSSATPLAIKTHLALICHTLGMFQLQNRTTVPSGFIVFCTEDQTLHFKIAPWLCYR